MGKLPIKKTRVLAYQAEKGRLKAKIDHAAKTLSNKKQLRVALFIQLKGMIDKIDPLEAIAIGTATFVIKSGMEWSEDVLVKIFKKETTVLHLIPYFGSILRMSQAFIPEGDYSPMQKIMDNPAIEILEWAISFCIAFVLIRHPEIITSTAGGLLGASKLLLGIL